MRAARRASCKSISAEEAERFRFRLALERQRPGQPDRFVANQ